jgi:Short C-terminal domain
MGLLGGIARTAVAAGTWTAVSNRVNRRQSERWANQQQAPAYDAQRAQAYQQPAPAYQQPAPAYQQPAPSGGRDRIAQLKDLADLKAKGILTEEEFATQKARVLAA